MDSDGKGLPKQTCRSNPTSYLKCETFDSAMPNGQRMFAFCLPGVLTGDIMEVCFGGVGWGGGVGVPISHHSQNNLP